MSHACSHSARNGGLRSFAAHLQLKPPPLEIVDTCPPLPLSNVATVQQIKGMAQQFHAGESEGRPLSLNEYKRYGRQMIMPNWGLPGMSPSFKVPNRQSGAVPRG